MHFNPQLFKVSISQIKLFGPLDFELSRFHCNAKMCSEFGEGMVSKSSWSAIHGTFMGIAQSKDELFL